MKLEDLARFVKKCKNCSCEFELSKEHRRNGSSPECCSRSCARKLQWRDHYENPKRKADCLNCGITFDTRLVNGEPEKKYCSRSCFAEMRFPDRAGRKRQGREIVMNALTHDAQKNIQKRISSICSKVRNSDLGDDMLHDWYVKLLSGHRCKLVHSAIDTLKEYVGMGIEKTFKDGKNFFELETEEMAEWQQTPILGLSPEIYVQYMYDLEKRFTPLEFELLVEMLSGKNRVEFRKEKGIYKGSSADIRWRDLVKELELGDLIPREAS